MKHLLIALCLFCTFAHAEYIDLTDGDILLRQMCTKDRVLYLCVTVKKNNKLYGVLLDKKGECAIYEIKDDKLHLIWARESV